MTSEDCETCGGSGEIDETLGGIAPSNPHASCPDCVARVPLQKYVMPKPRACICQWLGFMGFKCRAHAQGKE